MTPHPMKYYEDLRRAWRRLHVAAGAVLEGFGEGDLEAVDVNTKLAAEAMEDIVEAAGKFSKASADPERWQGKG